MTFKEPRYHSRDNLWTSPSNGKEKQSKITWYSDQRHLPHVQASYVGRLARLRDELDVRESVNFSQAVERVSNLYNHQREISNIRTPRNRKKDERNKRSKKEESSRVTCRTRARSAPEFEPLKGEKLVAPIDARLSPMSIERANNNSTRPLTWDEFNDILNEQSVKFKHKQMDENARLSTVRSKQVHFQRSDSFTRQMQSYDKDYRGIYRGSKRRDLSTSEKFEAELAPEFFFGDSLKDGVRSVSTISNNQTTFSQRLRPPTRQIRSQASYAYKPLDHFGPSNSSLPRYILQQNASKMFYLRKQAPSRNGAKKDTWFEFIQLSAQVQEKINSHHRAHRAHLQFKNTGKITTKCLFCANPDLNFGFQDSESPSFHRSPMTAPRNSPECFLNDNKGFGKAAESDSSDDETLSPSSRRTLVVDMSRLSHNAMLQ